MRIFSNIIKTAKNCSLFVLVNACVFGQTTTPPVEAKTQQPEKLTTTHKIELDDPFLLDQTIAAVLSKSISDEVNIKAVALYARMITSTTCEVAINEKRDILEVVETTTYSINKFLARLPSSSKVDWIELTAKVTDAIITGSIRSALVSKVKLSLLAKSIAYSTALPYMETDTFAHSNLVKIAKGINFGIPYKFIDSVLRSAPSHRAPTIIQNISRKTSHGTIAAAIEAGIEYEDFVHAATDAFSSSLITVAARKKFGVKRIALLTKYGSRGIMAGTIDATTDAALPIGNMGAIILSDYAGKIEIKRESTGLITPKKSVKTGLNLHQDYIITTGNNSSATLLFSNGTITILEENSQLIVEKFTQAPFDGSENLALNSMRSEPSSSQTSLNLKYGNILFDIKPLANDSLFQLKTPIGTSKFTGNGKAGSAPIKTTQMVIPQTKGQMPYLSALITSSLLAQALDNESTSSTTLGQAKFSGTEINTKGGISVIQPSPSNPNYTSTSTITQGEGGTFNSPSGESFPLSPGISVSGEATRTGRISGSIQSAPANQNSVKRITNKVASTESIADKTTISSIQEAKSETEATAKVEVSKKAAEVSKRVSQGLGKAGIGAIEANNLTDPSGEITSSMNEGTIVGTTIAALTNGLQLLQIVQATSSGLTQGAAEKALQTGVDPEIIMDALDVGQNTAVDYLTDLKTLLHSDSSDVLFGEKSSEDIGHLVDIIKGNNKSQLSELLGADFTSIDFLTPAQMKVFNALGENERNVLSQLSVKEKTILGTLEPAEIQVITNLNAEEIEAVRNLSRDELVAIRDFDVKELDNIQATVSQAAQDGLFAAFDSQANEAPKAIVVIDPDLNTLFPVTTVTSTPSAVTIPVSTESTRADVITTSVVDNASNPWRPGDGTFGIANGLNGLGITGENWGTDPNTDSFTITYTNGVLTNIGNR